jgi:NAD(P)-dependent dehydrogenase (short-subunit alcohol dehydrogenase family)
MENRLGGKVAVITGATSGIGEATAQLFAREGATVVLAGRSERRGAALAELFGNNAHFVRADVTVEDDIRRLIDGTAERFGKLDVLLNNAGSVVEGDLETITADQIDLGVLLLYSSVLLGTKYAVPHMKANGGGSIINTSSIAGLRYGQGTVLYSSLKAAVTFYSRLAGAALGPHGIRVNSISPGAIATPIFWRGTEKADTLSDEENAWRMEETISDVANIVPLKIAGSTYDIACAALYLASDEGRFVNCHDLVVDGGRTSMFNEYPKE